MKVLVVEDSTGTQNFIKKILTMADFEVETVDNGATALGIYNKFMPDVILLDMTMPVMGGKETLRKLLELDKNARVVISTALEDGPTIQSCMEMGAVGYIMKPFGINELVSIIKNSSHTGNDKNTRAFFSIIKNRIEADIRKLLNPLSLIILKQVKVINQERSPQTFSSPRLSQIKVVSQIRQESQIIMNPQFTGYVTEFGGQMNGEVISFVPKEDLSLVMEHHDQSNSFLMYDNGQTLCDIEEFFNIINQKVISVLSNAKSVSIQRDVVRLYDETKDKSTCWNDVIHASFEIISNEKIIPLEILLCMGRRYTENPRF